ncbi:GerAB/ArcD/ProY family transporter [Brevibacillus choshinensis]|uniref:GerAB/ArcD/ProY family transporter n=1 Tax=Brevibacillus choshinensis TaxID=54911 RepID=UPI002E2352CA|nr:GerAB/ArcD/ProY family transporter [Brevibacillus choshinensis]MED4582830.1 GerAB/ArcD/ProY family transporter [Brevibacillus choshinensis]MED4749787.1 GerAB/ArcD/ProY family transporter [Brevibacillus choshinensis]MED4779940.1 GerAB/ArcD/ProY family transporter [Brevibacillus choshinensis]
MNQHNQQARTVSLLSSFLVFFIIPSNQIGVGFMGFQSYVYTGSGHDAWVSVLIACAASMVAVWFMVRTLLLFESKDLYDIQELVYGKWIGKLMNTIYMAYLFLTGFTILRTYIEVVQAVMFPGLKAWFLATLLSLLIIYGVKSGIRVIVGYSYLSIVCSIWFGGLYYYPLQYAHWEHLLPIMEASLPDLLSGAQKMSFTIIGFEIIFFVFPFLKDKEHVQKYSQLALLFTTFIYVSLMIVSIVYYSGPQLLRTVWATLNLYKIVELPFLERFEYIAVAYWMFIITPNCFLYIWASTRGISKIFRMKQRTSLYGLCFLMIILTMIIQTRDQIDSFTDFVGYAGLVLSFGYPIVLYVLVTVKLAWQRRNKHQESA